MGKVIQMHSDVSVQEKPIVRTSSKVYAVRALVKKSKRKFKNIAMPLEVFQERAKKHDPLVYGYQ
jgi:hypothetical protein